MHKRNFDRSKFKVTRDISPTISGWLLADIDIHTYIARSVYSFVCVLVTIVSLAERLNHRDAVWGSDSHVSKKPCIRWAPPGENDWIIKNRRRCGLLLTLQQPPVFWVLYSFPFPMLLPHPFLRPFPIPQSGPSNSSWRSGRGPGNSQKDQQKLSKNTTVLK